MAADPAAWISRNLPVSPVPGLPHMRLHLARPESGVWRLAGDGAPPYWAWCWAGGLARARHVAAHPGLVAGRSVLDLGTGSGLVAIAAALAGAAETIACDTDPVAVQAAERNAALNAVAVRTLRADLLDGPPPASDCVLVGDLFYDADLAARLVPFLERCREAGIDVYVGDIGRHALPRDRLVALADWPVADFGDGPAAAPRVGTVYRLAAS